jgi:uncharacterized membrane protein (UPF0127 family)
MTAPGRAALGAALFFVMLGAMLAAGASTAEAQMRRETLTLVTAGAEHVINVEIAETAEEKTIGLMFRTSLADDAGMLFPYSPPQEATMWMRNTYIPLDMIFIRADGIVHRIERQTEPFSERIIASQGEVAAVLELKAGSADRLGLRPGDRVRHSLFGAKIK